MLSRRENDDPHLFPDQTLAAAGFDEWADTEPNNLNGNEYCGSVYETDGKYNDQDCSYSYGFICEKEKHI